MKNLLKSMFIFAALLINSAVAMKSDIVQATDTACPIQQNQQEQTSVTDTKLDQLVQAVLNAKSPAAHERAAFAALRLIITGVISDATFNDLFTWVVHYTNDCTYINHLIPILFLVLYYCYGNFMTIEDKVLKELNNLEKYIDNMPSTQKKAIADAFAKNYANLLTDKIKPEEYETMENRGEKLLFIIKFLQSIYKFYCTCKQPSFNKKPNGTFANIATMIGIWGCETFKSSDSSKKAKIFARIQKAISAAKREQAAAITAK